MVLPGREHAHSGFDGTIYHECIGNVSELKRCKTFSDQLKFSVVSIERYSIDVLSIEPPILHLTSSE